MSGTGIVVEALTDQVSASAVLADLAAMESVVTRVGRTSLRQLRAGDALDVAARLGRLARRVEALRLQALARVDEVDAARARGSVSTAAWLRAQGHPPSAANRDLALARKLAGHAEVAGALADGTISSDHGAVITRVTAELPPPVRAAGESALVEAAAGMDPGALAREAVRVLTRLHRDGSDRLVRQERQARERRELTLVDSGDGSFAVLGTLDREGAAVTNAAIDPLAAPVLDLGRAERTASPAQRRALALRDGGLQRPGLRPAARVVRGPPSGALVARRGNGCRGLVAAARAGDDFRRPTERPTPAVVNMRFRTIGRAEQLTRAASPDERAPQ